MQCIVYARIIVFRFEFNAHRHLLLGKFVLFLTVTLWNDEKAFSGFEFGKNACFYFDNNFERSLVVSTLPSRRTYAVQIRSHWLDWVQLVFKKQLITWRTFRRYRNGQIDGISLTKRRCSRCGAGISHLDSSFVRAYAYRWFHFI